MKYLNFKDLISYSEAFISFIFPKLDGINEIILFGSVARGESDKNSDIDLFFNIENRNNEDRIKNIINIELNKFYKSKIAEVFLLRGIKNEIKANVGLLEEWKLKRSIISEGIILYSRYKEIPKNLKGNYLFIIEPIKNITKRNKVIRELFGRNEKKYLKTGLIEKFNGKRLSPTTFIVPKEFSNEIIKFLGKEKISNKLIEFYTDEIH